MSESNYMDRGDRSKLLDSERLRRSDMQLVARAIRNRWPVSGKMRRRAVTKMDELLDSGSEETAVAAAKVLLAADALNVRLEESDKPQAPHLHLHAPANHEETTEADARRVRLAALAERLGIAGVVVEGAAEVATPDSDGAGSA